MTTHRSPARGPSPQRPAEDPHRSLLQDAFQQLVSKRRQPTEQR